MVGERNCSRSWLCVCRVVAAEADTSPPSPPAGHLTRDPRAVERKKPGQKKARKKFQWCVVDPARVRRVAVRRPRLTPSRASPLSLCLGLFLCGAGSSGRRAVVVAAATPGSRLHLDSVAAAPAASAAGPPPDINDLALAGWRSREIDFRRRVRRGCDRPWAAVGRARRGCDRPRAARPWGARAAMRHRTAQLLGKASTSSPSGAAEAALPAAAARRLSLTGRLCPGQKQQPPRAPARVIVADCGWVATLVIVM